jgi:nicotinate-nucleotide adenylyltransferase
VFGGAFDPPHNTHLALVAAAIQQHGLDEVRVFPTGHAWHKTRTLSAPEHRLEMARLAFASEPKVVVDPREIHRAGPTYTVDTLRELRAEMPGAELLLLIGADQARALPTWHAWQEILQLAIISVAERADSSGVSTPFDVKSLPAEGVNGSVKGRFEALFLPATDVSATNIRQRVGATQGIKQLVPEAVARYIEQHHLYQTAR